MGRRGRSEARESLVRRPGRLREGGRVRRGDRAPRASCARGLTSSATGWSAEKSPGEAGDGGEPGREPGLGWTEGAKGQDGEVVAKLVRAWFESWGGCAKVREAVRRRPSAAGVVRPRTYFLSYGVVCGEVSGKVSGEAGDAGEA